MWFALQSELSLLICSHDVYSSLNSQILTPIHKMGIVLLVKPTPALLRGSPKDTSDTVKIHTWTPWLLSPCFFHSVRAIYILVIYIHLYLISQELEIDQKEMI